MGHMYVYILLCTYRHKHIHNGDFASRQTTKVMTFILRFPITLVNYFPQCAKGHKYLIQVSGNHLFLHLVFKGVIKGYVLHFVYTFIHA